MFLKGKGRECTPGGRQARRRRLRVASMCPLDHVEWARALPPSEEPARLPAVLGAAACAARDWGPARLHEFREAALSFWRHRKRVTDPEWARELASLPPHSRQVLGGRRNLLLLEEMMAAAGVDDPELLAQLRQGFPLVGDIPGLPAERQGARRPASVSVDTLWRERHSSNAATLARVSRDAAQDVEVAAAFEEKAQEEVAAGRAQWVRLDQARAAALLCPRFPVDEGFRVAASGAKRRKVRCIDDFTANRVNAAAGTCGRVRHDTLDCLVALGREVARGRDVTVRFRKEDVVGAYKLLPLRAEDLRFACAVWGSAAREGWALQLWSCPFGASGSVYSWERVGHALRAIVAVLLLLPYCRYVDDWFALDRVVEPEARGRQWHWATPEGAAEIGRLFLDELLGWPLDPAKRSVDAESAVILGVSVSFDELAQALVFAIPDSKAAKWAEAVAECLREGTMSPAQAGKLAGRLSWGASAVYGRGARVYLAPLFWHAHQPGHKLTGRVVRALEWWHAFLQAVPVRRVPLHWTQRARVSAWADATGGGALAWVVDAGSSRTFASADAPRALWRWLLPRKTQVAGARAVVAACV